MQKKIVYVLVLMSCCVLGITGLQLYWNYQNYKTAVVNFKKDANNALSIAVDKEMMARREKLYQLAKNWLADSTIVKITCDTNNKEHQTVFTMEDVVPYYPDEKASKVSIGINSFKQKLARITPEAKKVFVEHFAKIIKDDLKEGVTHYYTQGLGHRIEREFEKSKVNKPDLIDLYKKELAKKNISSSIVLNPTYTSKANYFLTNKFNTAFRRPYDKGLVWAKLEDANAYYLREMKWLIVSSLLLIGITLFCFYYTVKTLFNQHKLVAIKNQFISNMTHEINTPLSSIQVTAEALQTFKPDEATREKYVDIILYQTQKLNELSKEILENAKLESLTFPMDEEIDLKALLANLIVDLKLENVVNYQSPQENFIIKGNRPHLTRSIANVLENAIKYNLAAKPNILISLSKVQKGINLSITDNGPGIADEFKDKVFDQFYRIPTGNVHNIKGYGLGLSYVKKVITQHKGVIQILDNQPMGSIFSINLPA